MTPGATAPSRPIIVTTTEDRSLVNQQNRERTIGSLTSASPLQLIGLKARGPVVPCWRTLLAGWAMSIVVSAPAAGAGAPDDERDVAATDTLQEERLLVIGSRLSGGVIDDAKPVTVIGRQALLDAGHASVGRFLQELPFMSGSPLGTTVGQRNSGGGASRGIETVELRGLGPERTLVLLNGRRLLPGGNGIGGVVDLGTVPVAMIERIEVLKTGASVEYGADAVAGVVNLITRERFEGVELRAQASATDRGDADAYDLSAVFGTAIGRGRVVTGVEFFYQNSVSKGERDFSSRLLDVSGPDNAIFEAGSSAPPQGNYRTSRGRLTLIDGAAGTSGADFRPFVGDGPDNDRWNFNPFEDLLQDSRRWSWFGEAHMQFAPAVEAFVEAIYQQRDSSTGLAPLPFFTNRLAGVTVSADSVYNPFNETLSDVRRRLVEAGPREFTQDNRWWRMLTGVRGERGNWRYDASLSHGKNRVQQTQSGDLLADRVAVALGPSFIDASGTARCGTNAQVLADCVPLNVFAGPGTITDQMLGFVAAGDLRDLARNEQTVFGLNVAGDLYELPTGSVAMAFGVEYRDEGGADVPAAQTQAGNTTGAARAPTSGGFHTLEAYAEWGVPLVDTQSQSLDLEFGLRAIEFANLDREIVFDTGLRYQPHASLVLRAAYSEPFRAPTVAELFGGASQSNPAVEDACADFATLTPDRIARCVAQGVPADGSFDQSGNETPLFGGGDAALRPEQAQVFTAGLTYRPAWAAALQINLDYYDIRIDDGITSLGANTILDQCLATGEEQFCGRIERNADGEIVAVRSALQNIANETARGADLEALYAHDVPRGRLSHRLLVSYLAERDLIASPGAAPFVGAGEFDADRFGALPRWRGLYRADWVLGRWDLGYSAQWVGALSERGGELFPATTNRVASRLYHNLNVGWQWRPATSLTLGIDNLTDRAPPFLVNADAANTDVGTYRLLGRTWRLRVQQRF